jgi:predicted Fe-Mo cluster-binding NifX family protein
VSIAVSAEDGGLEAAVDPRFGRCRQYLLVDPDTLDFEVVANTAAAESGGAGIRAAELVIEHGAEAIITGNVGPNAQRVVKAAGVAVYIRGEGTVGEAIEAYRNNALHLLTPSGDES